jgi:hypothetical protein
MEDGMSVPGRIGIILIIALALVDAFILMSGAKHAASAIETHALVEKTAMDPLPLAASDDLSMSAPAVVHPVAHEPLLSAAIREINLLMAKTTEKPAGI